VVFGGVNADTALGDVHVLCNPSLLEGMGLRRLQVRTNVH
jgi:hypothetical protein